MGSQLSDLGFRGAGGKQGLPDKPSQGFPYCDGSYSVIWLPEGGQTRGAQNLGVALGQLTLNPDLRQFCKGDREMPSAALPPDGVLEVCWAKPAWWTSSREVKDGLSKDGLPVARGGLQRRLARGRVGFSGVLVWG